MNLLRVSVMDLLLMLQQEPTSKEIRLKGSGDEGFKIGLCLCVDGPLWEELEKVCDAAAQGSAGTVVTLDYTGKGTINGVEFDLADEE